MCRNTNARVERLKILLKMTDYGGLERGFTEKGLKELLNHEY